MKRSWFFTIVTALAILVGITWSKGAFAQVPGAPPGQLSEPAPGDTHAAPTGDPGAIPKTEATLPEDPNAVPDDVKKTIGSDLAPGDKPKGTVDDTVSHFYGLWYDERSGDYSFKTLFPFWFERKQGNDRASVYGPYYQRRSPDEDADVAFPFYWHFRTKQKYTTIVGPFMHQEKAADDKSPATHKNWLAPLFFEGTTEDGGGYFHIPPLLTFTQHTDHSGLNIVGPMFCKWKGGPACDVRTADTIDLGVAPFYFYGKDRTSEYEVIPPLLHYYSYDDTTNSETNLWGPLLWQRDRKGGVFNIMPFFWHNWGKDEDHITLFPFFHYGWEGSSHLLVTPLFVEAKSKEGATTFASPLYARYRGRTELDMVTPLFWWYRDPDLGLDTKFVFPFFYKSDSPANHDLVIFPFYAHFKKPGVSSETFVTPLVHHKTSINGWMTNVYPIFFSGSNGSSSHLVIAPVLWDFASPKSRTTVAFPLYYRFADTESVSQLALNTYYHETKVKGGKEWEFHFFPLFSYGETPNGHWWNILYGLAGYTREGTMSKMRTLYIPITLSK